jgi:hypothetical protein
MSVAFRIGDRASCVNDACSGLILGALYFVEDIEMSAHGVQALKLIGQPHLWQACRFDRVPDPHPRVWPAPPDRNDCGWPAGD